MGGTAYGGQGGGTAQVGAGGGGAAGGGMLPAPRGCLIGTTSLQIGDSVTISGDVATDALTLGIRSIINGDVNVFGRAMLGAMSRINGSLDSRESVSLATGATVAGGTHVPGVAAQSRLPLVAFSEGNAPVAIDSASPHILPPGDYGAVDIQARATLTIQGGTYTLGSLNVGQLAKLIVENSAPISLFIQGSVMVASGVSIQVAGAEPVLIYSNGSTLTVAASLPAPIEVVAPSANATIIAGDSCVIGGCIGAGSLSIQAGCSVNGMSTLPSAIAGPHAK